MPDRLTDFERQSIAAHVVQRVTRLRLPLRQDEHNEHIHDGDASDMEFSQPNAGKHTTSEALDAQEYQAEDEDEVDFGHHTRRHLHSRKRKRTTTRGDKAMRGFIVDDDVTDDEDMQPQMVASRHSARMTRHRGDMQEKAIDDIYRSDSDEESVKARRRAGGVLETFQPIDETSPFCQRHISFCDSCEIADNLVYCQGCSLAYHQACLGPRTSRGHSIIKVDDDAFVLLCKHCNGTDTKKNKMAPHGGKCEVCLMNGNASLICQAHITALQTDEGRNAVGIGSVTDRMPINNADHVLYRCRGCYRAWHNEHLPARRIEQLQSEHETISQQLMKYCQDWTCNECARYQSKISTIIAWRPREDSAVDGTVLFSLINEDMKQYLVKFSGESYFRAIWVSGAWLWRKAAPAQRIAFAKAKENQHAKLTAEVAIPDEYLRTEIVLDVIYQPDGAGIEYVQQALIKFEGLPYEEACWETPPHSQLSYENDGHGSAERLDHFERAYEDWDSRRQLQPLPEVTLAQRLRSHRRLHFEGLELQPALLTGGTLMDYQLAGLNWLYYHWYTLQNAILGDEMGLGKTIQVIGFLATLIEKLQCYPFLIVVPNSTCPNWRREFMRWAPDLKVATYYGSKLTRDMVANYEMFPDDSKQLKCHVIITSYEAAADESTQQVFRRVKWQGLIVDEGQRLKNDKSNLYAVLAALNVPFRLLLTGTPLQNNQRELFNLLQFLDRQHNAVMLEQQYQELSSEKIVQLHNMIKPYFLRRTKQQVLSLPPMQQIVVPVDMSAVQRKVYKTILTKNAEVMRTLLAGKAGKKSAGANYNNILMQLRKCLCHPFVYSRDVEERVPDLEQTHRNLVNASDKLKLLEIMLPLLQAGGHRVLIFSQFLDALDIIEDFLTGLKLDYQRLDGSVSAMEKQKRIDLFNAADSHYFAFLLSTRSGGVGINLTSADTVIILDPDFNPHQDLQAISRAHRYGQDKPVLCFRLVTVGSAEERIMSIGKRKLALDKVLIQHLHEQDHSHNDLMTILQHGVKELFSNNEGQSIVYDEARVRSLLDRTNMSVDKATDEGIDWSYAEVWKTQEGSHLTEDAWDKILKDRERRAFKAASQQNSRLGRGRRKRGDIDYTGCMPFADLVGLDAPEINKFPDVEKDDQDFKDNGELDSEEDKAAPSRSKLVSRPTKQSVVSGARPVQQSALRGGKIAFKVEMPKQKRSKKDIPGAAKSISDARKKGPSGKN